MPQTKSAKKALRQSARKRVVNLQILKQLKREIKKFRQRPNTDNFVKVQSVLDTAAKKRVISKNKAARLKSGLAKTLPRQTKTTKSTVKKSAKKSPQKKVKTKNDLLS